MKIAVIIENVANDLANSNPKFSAKHIKEMLMIHFMQNNDRWKEEIKQIWNEFTIDLILSFANLCQSVIKCASTQGEGI